jgi:hypothetical protein
VGQVSAMETCEKGEGYIYLDSRDRKESAWGGKGSFFVSATSSYSLRAKSPLLTIIDSPRITL